MCSFSLHDKITVSVFKNSSKIHSINNISLTKLVKYVLICSLSGQFDDVTVQQWIHFSESGSNDKSKYTTISSNPGFPVHDFVLQLWRQNLELKAWVEANTTVHWHCFPPFMTSHLPTFCFQYLGQISTPGNFLEVSLMMSQTTHVC